ncbi:MAG: glucose-6-phosphate isomerase [Kangiellaceae bacterium]|nr:glucose-6-phosphate isomerase [Kangiellaceae bacterium]
MQINKTPSWKKLEKHLESEILDKSISELFSDKNRFKNLSFEFDQLFIDFSKQKLSPQTVNLLVDLAESIDLKGAIKSLYQGDKINTTENRAALHTALRLQPDKMLEVEGKNINQDIQDELISMSVLVDKLHLGEWRGFSGQPITDVVNLGVGGSDLGPMLVCEALDEFKLETENQVNIHFASTMDGSQVSTLFGSLNPEKTLFIIVSKSFGTIDTLSNAASAKAWIMSACQNEKLVKQQHFIGISTNNRKMSEWGIQKNHQLQLWDWVGGRFSLWSTVGMTIAVKLGMDGFREFLNGANSLDEHFQNEKLNQNLPALLGLIGIWNANFLDINAQAILPYDARLKYFPNYLTQLEMESNGKAITNQGDKIDYQSCPILWGEVGPNAQHAFYQLLHQGTRRVACDFIAPINRFSQADSEQDKALQEQHQLTLANCLAQSRALMIGSECEPNKLSHSETAPHKHYPGNQPSTTILIEE